MAALSSELEGSAYVTKILCPDLIAEVRVSSTVVPEVETLKTDVVGGLMTKSHAPAVVSDRISL